MIDRNFLEYVISTKRQQLKLSDNPGRLTAEINYAKKLLKEQSCSAGNAGLKQETQTVNAKGGK